MKEGKLPILELQMLPIHFPLVQVVIWSCSLGDLLTGLVRKGGESEGGI